MLGKDLLIASNGRILAAQRTCNLNIEQGTIETCSPVSGPWRDYKPSTLGWQVSCAGLICSPEHAEELMDLICSRKKVRLSFYDPELRIVRSGYAIPTSLDDSADIGSLASYAFQFLGCGALEKVPYSAWQEPDFVATSLFVKYQWISPQSHPVIDPHLQDACVTSYRLVLTQASRIVLETSQQMCYLYHHDGEDTFYGHISLKDNIWLYQHEIAHVQTDDPETDYSTSILLPPGTYYIALNGEPGARYFRPPLYCLLSLPTE